jgi:translocation and assembly module TamA
VAFALAAGLMLSGCAAIKTALYPLGITKPEGYNYEPKIVGVGGRLADRLEEASVLFQKRYEPPSNLQGLRRRAQSDRDVFLRVMRSRGWYEGSVDVEIHPDLDPPLVEMKVTRGNRYTLARFDIEGLPADATYLQGEGGLATLGVLVGSPALAETVLRAETRLLTELAAKGYPYAALAPRRAVIDRRARTIEVSLAVDAGPYARFGDVTVKGLTLVDEDYVLHRLTFEKGEPFSPAKIEESRKALFASGVFSGVSLGWGKREDVTPDGLAPIEILVAEGKMHSIGAGLSYSSVDGAGGKAFWEHRNVSGKADRFRAEVDASEQEQGGGISYRRPDFLLPRQNLLLDATADADKPIAYDRYALTASAGVEYPFSRRFTGTAGLGIEQSEVNSAADDDGTRSFTLIGVPLGLRYDGSDNILDPSRGHRTFLSLTPWVSVLGDGTQFLVTRLTESFYVPITDDRDYIWATRLTVGSIVGDSRSDLPADKRMYAGGGDSIRGYQYQLAGPIIPVPCVDENGDGEPDDEDCNPNKANFRPLGGRSLFQVGTELRWKVTENFGLVPFVEGAGVFGSSYPDFDEEFLWAAGLGMRYFTVAGPIRLDLGFPLTPRQPDDIFQVYISLGQAF